jgi:hypothetical protein
MCRNDRAASSRLRCPLHHNGDLQGFVNGMSRSASLVFQIIVFGFTAWKYFMWAKQEDVPALLRLSMRDGTWAFLLLFGMFTRPLRHRHNDLLLLSPAIHFGGLLLCIIGPAAYCQVLSRCVHMLVTSLQLLNPSLAGCALHSPSACVSVPLRLMFSFAHHRPQFAYSGLPNDPEPQQLCPLESCHRPHLSDSPPRGWTMTTYVRTIFASAASDVQRHGLLGWEHSFQFRAVVVL